MIFGVPYCGYVQDVGLEAVCCLVYGVCHCDFVVLVCVAFEDVFLGVVVDVDDFEVERVFECLFEVV